MSVVSHHSAMMAGRLGAPGWYDPMFISGAAGMVFDFNDPATLYTDESHLLPVLNVGDEIRAIMCKRTGQFAIVQGACKVTYDFDSGRSRYCGLVVDAAIGTASIFLAENAVPSQFMGDGDVTLIAVADYSSSHDSLPALVGEVDRVSSPAIAIGNYVSKLSTVQFVTGTTIQDTTYANGTFMVTGQKYQKPIPSDGRGIEIWRGGSQRNGVSQYTASNLMVPDFHIGIGMAAGENIYSCIAINRYLSTDEITANALVAL